MFEKTTFVRRYDFMLRPYMCINFNEAKKKYDSFKESWLHVTWNQLDAMNAAVDPKRRDDLVMYAFHYYSTKDTHADWYRIYGVLVTQAIKANNIQGMEILWSICMRYDDILPRYDLDLLTAAEFSNLDTFLHVMWYRSYFNSDDTSHESIAAAARKNLDDRILRLTRSLTGFADRVVPMFDCYDDDEISNDSTMYYETVRYSVDKLRAEE